MNNRKIILHCGAPKTGSTSLQFLVGRHEDDLKELGIFYPHRFISKDDVDILNRTFTLARQADDIAPYVARARGRLEEIFSDPDIHTILLSNESLLGEPFHYPDTVFFPLLDKSICLLQAVFEGYDVRVEYTMRDYASFMESYYVQFVRRGGHCSLKEFGKIFDIHKHSWSTVVTALNTAFGEQNVSIYDYHSINQNRDAYYNRLTGDHQLTKQISKAASKLVMNKSVGGVPLLLARLVNAFLIKVLGYPRRKAGTVTSNKVLRATSVIFPSTKHQFPSAFRNALQEKYKAESEPLLTPNWTDD